MFCSQASCQPGCPNFWKHKGKFLRLPSGSNLFFPIFYSGPLLLFNESAWILWLVFKVMCSIYVHGFSRYCYILPLIWFHLNIMEPDVTNLPIPRHTSVPVPGLADCFLSGGVKSTSEVGTNSPPFQIVSLTLLCPICLRNSDFYLSSKQNWGQ